MLQTAENLCFPDKILLSSKYSPQIIDHNLN
jgi:hypothetical protein